MCQTNNNVAGAQLSERTPLARRKFRPAAMFVAIAVSVAFGFTWQCRAEDALESLAKPQEGRSMRATSTMRVGEVRRGGAMKLNPKGDFKGDLDEASNWDSFTIPPGKTHVLLDEQGPGVITHMWITFLGPERQKWAPKGSANHQEMLLRMYWDGSKRPAVEAPLGDFFANCFGKRREVVSIPVTVADGTAYNCYWRMTGRNRTLRARRELFG